MKYTFTTSAKEQVTIDRSLLSGKVKIYVDGKAVGPSHQGKRGATGTFYPVNRGTLEVRSSPWELVPRAWYNEDWVELVPPLTAWQYVLIALPFVSTAFVAFGQIAGLIIGALATLISVVVMHTQRPIGQRLLICLFIA